MECNNVCRVSAVHILECDGLYRFLDHKIVVLC